MTLVVVSMILLSLLESAEFVFQMVNRETRTAQPTIYWVVTLLCYGALTHGW